MTESTTPNPAANSGLFAFAECEVVNLQNGAALLIDKYSDAQAIVIPTVARAMQHCRVFRTLEEHTGVLTASIPELSGQQDDVMGVLNMLKDAGLMVSAEAVCDKLNAEVPPAVDLPPTRAFIITCDRPEAVKRLLQSMLHAGNLTRHEALYLVDDSRDADNARLNRAAVEEFNFTCPRDMHYIGADEAKALMDSLINELPAQEAAIRFLIDRERWADKKTYGLARNLCLLLSIGKRAIVMDDDVICAAVDSPQKQQGLRFGDLAREADFYTSQQDILNRTSRAEFDPLNGHAKCLGLNIGQTLARLEQTPVTPDQLKGADSAQLSQWSADSRVLITQSGSIGDPGTPGMEWVFTLDPASTGRMQALPGSIESALTGRHCWLGQPRPQFAKLAVMSQMTGLDNSQLLPPYFPAFRGEDYVFGAMTEFLHPQAAVLEYDWCVPHFPLEERQGEAAPPPADSKGNITPGKYITDHTAYDTNSSPERRLANLAALCQDVADRDERGLLALYRREVAENQGQTYGRLRQALQAGNNQLLKQDWLQQSLNATADSMAAPAMLTDIKGIPADMDSASLAGEITGKLAQLANALHAWLAIREAAAKCTLADLHIQG